MPELVTNDIRALAGKDRSEAWNYTVEKFQSTPIIEGVKINTRVQNDSKDLAHGSKPFCRSRDFVPEIRSAT